MGSFGENLKRERELRGIDLREVAEATKISFRYLDALEGDRIEVLPSGIFRKSFVREYARFVGLDVERVVSDFLHAYPNGKAPADASSPQNTVLPKRDAAKPATASVAAAPAASKSGLYRRIFFGLAVLLVTTGALRFNRARTASEVEVTPLPPVVVVPRDELLPIAGPAPDASHDDSTLVVILSASESCWVGAQADGRPVLNKLLGEGETQTLTAADKIVLSVGNAGALSVRINDRPGLSLGRPGEVRRNIVITRESLPSLVEDASPRRSSHSG